MASVLRGLSPSARAVPLRYSAILMLQCNYFRCVKSPVLPSEMDSADGTAPKHSNVYVVTEPSSVEPIDGSSEASLTALTGEDMSV